MDAARRFAAQPGSDEWAGRLHVVGADFRDLRGLEAMYAAVGLGLGLGLGIGLGFGGALQPAESSASEIVTGMSLELGGGVPDTARDAMMEPEP